MRSNTWIKGQGGFTLVEVVVALAIAGGSLILLLSANNASLRKSVFAKERMHLERIAESRVEEVLSGGEAAPYEQVAGLPGWRSGVRRSSGSVASLGGLEKLKVTLYAPDGTPVLERSVYRYGW